MPREKTTALIDAVRDGLLTWERIGCAALNYMSEDDVADMAHHEELLPRDEDDEDDDEDELAYWPREPEFAPKA